MNYAAANPVNIQHLAWVFGTVLTAWPKHFPTHFSVTVFYMRLPPYWISLQIYVSQNVNTHIVRVIESNKMPSYSVSVNYMVEFGSSVYASFEIKCLKAFWTLSISFLHLIFLDKLRKDLNILIVIMQDQYYAHIVKMWIN